MSEFDAGKDYYEILGAERGASHQEIERLYKRKAAEHHPDRGGSEEQMKILNEAYGVLRNEGRRRHYDAARKGPTAVAFVPVTSPAAQEVGYFGHFLSALLCLFVGFFLLFLVRFQWIWFLWPLAILAALVMGFGILMAHSAMLSANSRPGSRWHRHTVVQEVIFWVAVAVAGYGVYLLLSR